jgi:hypothetical protein
MSTHSGKKVKHFVYLNPDEKLYIVTRRVAGFDDHQLVEIVFPTLDNEHYFDPDKSCHQQRVEWFDDGTLSLMQSDYEDKKGKYHDELRIIEAIAQSQTPKDEVAYVSVPLNEYLKLVFADIDRRNLKTLDAEPVEETE